MGNGCPFVLDPNARDIYGEAAQLRKLGSAVKVELPQGICAWAINHFDVAKQILADPRVTKSARNHWPAFINGEIPQNWELISWVMMDNMATAYGADHLRLRRTIAYAFTSKRIRALQPAIQALADEVLDQLAERPVGEVVDLRESFAAQLPSRLIADLIGLSDEARREALRMMEVFVSTSVSPQEAEAALGTWRQAMENLIALKTREPGEDIATDLIRARDEGHLSDGELVDMIFAILGAGSETTSNLLDNSVVQLLSHPEQCELVRNGTVSWDDVLDEVLRLESPVAYLPLRYAVEDIELGDGTVIPRGEPILVNYSVGRDPALHGETADQFDLTRANKEHIAFGFGQHYCPGSGVARVVARIGLETLFRRFPDMSLAVPAEELLPAPTFTMHGHQTVPVLLRAIETVETVETVRAA